MKSDLIRSRPGASEIKPASAAAALPVAEGIWLSPGLSNSYLVVTDDGRVVINTGMGFESGHHRRLYDAVDSGPVRYILLTQGHVDHVGGVDTFREPGTLLIAQANNPTCQADDERIHRFRVRRSQPYWAPAIAAADAFIKGQPKDAAIPAQSKPTPDVLFDDEYDVRAGRHALRVHLHARWRDDRLDRRLAAGPRHRVRRQRLQRAVRPLPEPRDVARRPAALPTPVRRRGATGHRPRARDPVHRALRPDRRARHDPRRADARFATPCSTSTTRPSRG